MFPWSWFTPKLLTEAKRKVSNLEFLALQEFTAAHALRDNTGVKDDGATGDMGTLTANTGKDMYLIEAWVTLRQDVIDALPKLFEAVLRINGTIRDRLYLHGMNTSTDSGGNAGGGNGKMQGKFILKGVQVLAGEIIKIEVITSDADLDATGTVSCWEQDTGTTPQIPSI